MENKLFYCYSPKLKKFLVGNGIRFLHIGEHQITHKKFWVFEGTKPLNDYLAKWREGRK